MSAQHHPDWQASTTWLSPYLDRYPRLSVFCAITFLLLAFGVAGMDEPEAQAIAEQAANELAQAQPEHEPRGTHP